MLHGDYLWTSPSVDWGIIMSGNILYICHTLLRLFGGFVSLLGEDLSFCLQRFVEFGSWGGLYCRGAVELIACTVLFIISRI